MNFLYIFACLMSRDTLGIFISMKHEITWDYLINLPTHNSGATHPQKANTSRDIRTRHY